MTDVSRTPSPDGTPRLLPTRGPIGRRTLLGGLGASVVLAACTNGGQPTGEATSATPTSSEPTMEAGEDVVSRALEVVGVDAPIGLSIVTFSPEVLTGEDQGFVFGLIDMEQNAAPGLDTQVWFVAADGETVVGPYSPTFHATEEPALTAGVYRAEVSLETSGTYDVVVATTDDSVAGTGVAQVRSPSQALVVPPGAPLPLAETPTVDDPQNLEILCTREPDCSMHGSTVAGVIERGEHLVLTVATPAFCSTTICGPTVDIVEDVKNATERDDVTFVHVEVYIDEGNTPTDYVTQLALPSEPWTFVVDSAGIVVDRFGGPVIPEVLQQCIADLPTAAATEAPTDGGTETATDDVTPTETETATASETETSS